MRQSFLWLSVIALSIGCHKAERASAPSAKLPDPCRVVLARHSGEGKVDREISRLQREIAQNADPAPLLDRLGWLFVSKARTTFDDGFYTLAEQCALCLETKQPGSPEAMLLRGHALHSMHRFKEAETLARELVVTRGAPFDFGLLGDVLMEQGRLEEAIPAYQTMLDLKPDLHAYARAAHMRWLKGDLAGASEAMRLAVAASSPHDPESAAWVHTRLAAYEFQAAHMEEAHRLCDAALIFHTNYPPALLLRGRILLSEGFSLEAVDVLQQATQSNPLPEYQWTLAEALVAAGRLADAQALDRTIKRGGPANDPRTCALHLATRREDSGTALMLAKGELRQRADVFTHDALAWCFAAAGLWPEARSHMEQALSEGTQDARLFYHAAHIAAKAGPPEKARRWCEQAMTLKHLLLPSELEHLAALFPNQVSLTNQ